MPICRRCSQDVESTWDKTCPKCRDEEESLSLQKEQIRLLRTNNQLDKAIKVIQDKYESVQNDTYGYIQWADFAGWDHKRQVGYKEGMEHALRWVLCELMGKEE